MVFVILGTVYCCKDKKRVMKFNSCRPCTHASLTVASISRVLGVSGPPPLNKPNHMFISIKHSSLPWDHFYNYIICERMTGNSYVSCTLSIDLDEPQHVSQ